MNILLFIIPQELKVFFIRTIFLMIITKCEFLTILSFL